MSIHNMFSWRNKTRHSNEYPQHVFMEDNKTRYTNEYPQHVFMEELDKAF